MQQENMELRLYARGKAVPLWRIAEVYGIHVVTLIARLRKPLCKEDADRFIGIVDSLSAEGQEKDE